MKDKPILFSTSMVQAIQEGRKKLTRRIIKSISPQTKVDDTETFFFKCPYQIGQKLWVKETHYLYGKWIKNGISKTGKQKWKFKVLNSKVLYYENPPEVLRKNSYREKGWYKRPAIFMPKKYARIWLEVIDTRIERLQDISEGDAYDEGLPWCDQGFGILKFSELWDSINKKKGYGWKSNPYVRVIEFKRVK